MPIRVTVQHRDGGHHETTVWPSTEVEFEDYFGVIWSEAFAKEHVPQKYLYFVAWHSLYEEKKTTAPFGEWIKTVGEVRVAGDQVPPTVPGAPPGS